MASARVRQERRQMPVLQVGYVIQSCHQLLCSIVVAGGRVQPASVLRSMEPFVSLESFLISSLSAMGSDGPSAVGPLVGRETLFRWASPW